MKNAIPKNLFLAAAVALSATGCKPLDKLFGGSGEPAASAGAPRMPAPTVGVSRVGSVEINPVHRYSGRVLSPATVAVVPQVSGTIVEVAFTEGAAVKKGDLLYRIDDVKYAASVAAARAAVAQAQAGADLAEKTFARTKALFDKNVASAADLDSAASGKATSLAALDAARAQLVLAEDNLAHCRITADVDGKIGLNAFTAGNYVSAASGALTTIVGQDPLRVSFPMATGDLLRHYGGEAALKEGFEVRVKLADGGFLDAEGEFEFVSNSANASTDTVTVYAKIPNADGRAVPGAAVTLEVRGRETRKAIAIPAAATSHTRDEAFVWVVGENNAPERRVIEIGLEAGDWDVVESGLSEGETIIVAGTHKVIPGMPVNPVPVSAE